MIYPGTGPARSLGRRKLYGALLGGVSVLGMDWNQPPGGIYLPQ